MFACLFACSLFIHVLANVPCSLLHQKLNKYAIRRNPAGKSVDPRLCQGLLDENSCCAQLDEETLQNATALELDQRLELHSISLYETLLRLTVEFNNTIVQLIESARNETHAVFQQDHPVFYQGYRLSIDAFFRDLLTINSRTYQHEIKTNTEEVFRQMLRQALSPTITPRTLMCLWGFHPFGNRPSLIAEQLQTNLGKLGQLHELLKLSTELVQIMASSVTHDPHCLDSYVQLSYCNLCAGRPELPCLSNCVDVIESCLTNLTLVHDAWMHFLDVLENTTHFAGIEKNLVSLGLAFSDVLSTFLKSENTANQHIIDQCGQIRRREEILANDRPLLIKYSHSLSVVDRQLISIRESLHLYESFWLILPKQICQLNGMSSSNGTTCWTGTRISLDGRHSIPSGYDKPLNLRVQWVLKEMREKSQVLGQSHRTATGMSNALTTHGLKVNLTDELDDYPHDSEFDYSDYAYEDSSDDLSTLASTTAPPSPATVMTSPNFLSSSLSFGDDTDTVSYYDYGEQDMYSDDDIDETTTELVQTDPPRTTSLFRIPSYHRRRPVIWNITSEDGGQLIDERRNSSTILTSSFLSFVWLILIFVLFDC